MNIYKKHAYDKNTVLYIEIMLGGNPICCKNVTKAHQNQRGSAVCLRVMRVMRLLQIAQTPWRMRYIRLYCAVRIMESNHAPAFGSRPTQHCVLMMQEIIRDSYQMDPIHGVSHHLETLIDELQTRLQRHAAAPARVA